MSWKGESNIKYCVGTTVELVQRFNTIQTLDTIDGEPMEFEWYIFPGFTTLHVAKVQEFMNKMSEPEQFQVRIIFMSMFNDIIWGSKENERECESSANFVSIYARRFSSGMYCFACEELMTSSSLIKDNCFTGNFSQLI